MTCCLSWDCPISALGLELSLMWRPGSKLLLDPRFFLLIRRNLSLSWVCNELLILLKHVRHMAPGQSHSLPLFCSLRGVCAVHCPETALWRDPMAMGDWSTLEMMILLHLFSFLWVKHCSNQGLVCWVLLNNSEPIEDAMGQAVWDHTSGGWHCYTLWHPLHSENLHQRLVAGSSCSTKMKPSFWFKKSQSRVIWNSYEHLAAMQNALKSVSSKMWNILLRGLRLIWPILI